MTTETKAVPTAKKKATRKKAAKKTVKKPTQAVIEVPAEAGEFDEFQNAISRVEDEIEAQFPDDLVKLLKKIAHEISVIGLTESEACLISNYPHEKFLELKQQYPIVERLMLVKDLEYKRNLLKGISAKAGGDDKVGMWLLGARYPNEFNKRKGAGKGGGDDDGGNLVGAAVEFVRKSGDANGMVSEESGRAFIIKGKGKKDVNLQSIKDVLV